MSGLAVGMVVGACIPFGVLFQIAAAVRTGSKNDKTANNLSALFVGYIFFGLGLAAWIAST